MLNESEIRDVGLSNVHVGDLQNKCVKKALSTLYTTHKIKQDKIKDS